MSTDLLITTADELFEMPDDGFRYELVRGELRKMSPAGGEHGEIGLFLGGHLMAHVRKHRLGSAYGADTGFKISSEPDTVLAPDAAFVSRERVQTISDRVKFVPLAPDLAIEVLSPTDTYSETSEKIDEFLLAGTRAVVLVDPRKKVVRVYRSTTQFTSLTESDTLEIPDIVPGWSVPVREIFHTE